MSRGNWTGQLDFILSCLGYAVGLGNIWRFPYLCYQSGGGAFLIPYVIFLFTCAIPIWFLEISFGQFASLSPTTIWRICPLLKGVGYGMVTVSTVCAVYYNIIMAWTVYFLVMSLRAVLPWATCDNDWNTDACSLNRNSTSVNNSSPPILIANTSRNDTHYTVSSASQNKSFVAPSQEFWHRDVLQLTEGIEDLGGIRWELLLCLLASWVVVFLCLSKGVKTSGRVVYVTATFPYIVLVILLIRGVTLPGAGNGIRYYLVPQWEKLLTFKVWGDAAVQIFYSVGIAWGGLITMASYNKFHHNCYRDAMMLPLLNCGTSVLAGLVVFSILGFLAQETGRDVSDVVTQGPGLTFVAYPEAVSKLPISPLWAVLFFLMLFTVGIDTQFGMVETTVSGFEDEFPRQLHGRKTLFTAAICTLFFLLGIPCVTQGGIYVLQIMDWYCASFSLMFLSIAECAGIAWIYGAERFLRDIELMIGYRPTILWAYAWKFLSPLIILVIWLFSIAMLAPVSYGSYQYPGWAIALGWLLGLLSLLPVPLNIVFQVYKREGTLLERLKESARPSADWGPAKENMTKYNIPLSVN